MARQGVVRYKDRKAARKEGKTPLRKRREPSTATLPADAGFKPREVPRLEPAKAQLQVRRIQPLTAPAGAFDDMGRPTFSIEDIRDDTISVIRNSPLTFDQIRAKGGPTPATLTKWLERTTQRPQLNTIASALDACGFEFKVVAKARGKKPRTDERES